MRKEQVKLASGQFIQAEVYGISEDGNRGHVFLMGPGATLQEKLENGREIQVVKAERIWNEVQS